MRIAYFSPHFAEYSVRLALASAEAGPVLLAVTEGNLRQECPPALIEEASGKLKLLRFTSQGKAQRLWALLRIVLAMIWFRPDVVHIQEQADPFAYWVVRVLSLFYPILMTVHDPKPHAGADAVWAARARRFREGVRALARTFHVHGAFCRAELESVVGTARSIVSTQHGLILTPNPEQTRAPQRRRILMFGRMQAYKGLDVLIEAAEVLLRKGVDFQLVLAGRGPELDRLMPRIAGQGAISVLGKFLDYDEAVAEFQKAAVVVVPYEEATQSGVVAAAYGNSRPVLATRVGGLVDAVREGDTGLLIAPGDADILAQSLLGLIEEDAIWTRLMAGVCTTPEGFGWADISATLQLAYADLARGRGG